MKTQLHKRRRQFQNNKRSCCRFLRDILLIGALTFCCPCRMREKEKHLAFTGASKINLSTATLLMLKEKQDSFLYIWEFFYNCCCSKNCLSWVSRIQGITQLSQQEGSRPKCYNTVTIRIHQFKLMIRFSEATTSISITSAFELPFQYVCPDVPDPVSRLVSDTLFHSSQRAAGSF